MFLRQVDDFLKARQHGSESGDDDAAGAGFGKQNVQRRGHQLLSGRAARSIGIGAVRQQGEHAVGRQFPKPL